MFCQRFYKDSCIELLFIDSRSNYFSREVLNIEVSLEDFKNSKFKKFFQHSLIDTPAVLNNVGSLKRLKGTTGLSSLSSYLFRSGQKYKMQKLLLNVFTKIFNTFLLSKKTTTEFT
jgi:hypothetical protein